MLTVIPEKALDRSLYAVFRVIKRSALLVTNTQKALDRSISRLWRAKSRRRPAVFRFAGTGVTIITTCDTHPRVMSGSTRHNSARVAEWAALIGEEVPEEVADRGPDAATDATDGA